MKKEQFNQVLEELKNKLQSENKIKHYSLEDNDVEYCQIEYDNAHWQTLAYLDVDFAYYQELKDFFENETLIETVSVKRTDQEGDLISNNISRAIKGLRG